jgi:nucleotide-binding universal stress UspA family protein
MKTILFPTDFSEASNKAKEFAIEIAKKTNAKILATNAFFIPILNIDIPPSFMEEMYDEEKSDSETELEKICKSISSETSHTGENISCDYYSNHNTPVLEINKIAEKYDVDLIVMGTNIKDEAFGLMGSTTIGVLNYGKHPLLIIHKDSQFKSFKNIVLAVEDTKEDVEFLNPIIVLAKTFDAEVSIVHAFPKNKLKKHPAEIKNYEAMIRALSSMNRFYKLKFHYIQSEDVAEGLDYYVRENKSHLLVLIKYSRGWIESIFHKSVIKTMIKKENLPVLILYKNED